MEVRAFGILLEELVVNSANLWQKHEEESRKTLTDLAEQCLDSVVQKRPTFAQIADIVANLMLGSTYHHVGRFAFEGDTGIEHDES